MEKLRLSLGIQESANGALQQEVMTLRRGNEKNNCPFVVVLIDADGYVVSPQKQLSNATPMINNDFKVSGSLS